MTKGIDEFVSENREDVRKIDSTFVPVSNQSTQTFSFSGNEINVSLSIEVYTRSLNNSLISGHPDGATHGSGHGVSGDQRGEWTLEEDTAQGEKFVQSGRNNIRDTLAGDTTGSINQTAVGSGTSSPVSSDTSLGSENGRVFAWGKAGANSNETIGESIFLFHEFGDVVSEYGVYSEGGNLYNRITTNQVNPTQNEELRVETKFTIEGDGVGNSVITHDGEDRVAKSIRSTDSPIGLEEFQFGSGTQDPNKNDSQLGNSKDIKVAEREKGPEILTVHTFVFQNEPSNQPFDITEIGVFTNNSYLFWRARIESFTKNSDKEFEAFASFRAK